MGRELSSFKKGAKCDYSLHDGKINRDCSWDKSSPQLQQQSFNEEECYDNSSFVLDHLSTDFFFLCKMHTHDDNNIMSFFSSLFVNISRDVNPFRWQRVQHVYSLLRRESLAVRTIARGYLRASCWWHITHEQKEVFGRTFFKFSCHRKGEKCFFLLMKKKGRQPFTKKNCKQRLEI